VHSPASRHDLNDLFLNLKQVYVPVQGNISLHIAPSGSETCGSSKEEAKWGIRHKVETERTGSAKDHEDKTIRIIIKNINMHGCTLYPGTQVCAGRRARARETTVKHWKYLLYRNCTHKKSCLLCTFSTNS
jgi:hypothetical protein